MVFLATAMYACGGSDGGPEGLSTIPGTLQRVFSNLPPFDRPVGMFQAPNDGARWFVVEQSGKVLVFDNLAGVSVTSVFVDITGRVEDGGERGLLGMAFHPDFPLDARVFLSYTAMESPLGLVSRVSEFSTNVGGQTLDVNSERVLLTVEQPEGNHKGGNIAFGPDRMLYIGFGDGGGANDQHGAIGNAQLTTTLLGKMLRINVNSGSPYGIPAGNLFASNPGLCNADGTGAAGCPEIYALGFRNPWRWSFDRQAGELWVADVGQGAREEIDKVVARANYGWRCFEGTLPTGFGCGLPANPLPPVAEYGRNMGASITGGYVYRGSAVQDLVGRYVFGDFISGRIFSIDAATPPTVTMSNGFESGLGISSFAEDASGELYVVNYGGTIFKIVP